MNLTKANCECAACLDDGAVLEDPRASHQDLIRFHNGERRTQARYNQRIHHPSREVVRAIKKYMSIVSDDADATLFGYLEMERLGIVYFRLAETDREESGWIRSLLV